MHTRNRAVRRASFFRQVFAADISDRVLLKWNSWIAALLRAVMHQPVLADIQITGAGAASPLVRLPEGDVVLKRINPGEAAFFKRLHLVIDTTFFIRQRLQLSIAIVNNSNRGAKSKLQRAFSDGECILRITNSAADY